LYDEALRGTGLRITQFTLLQTLTLAGELTQRGLGELLAIDSTTLTRTLGPLEHRGWIRSRSGTDRRERHWAITAAGSARLDKALPAWEVAQRRVRARGGGGRLSSLVDDLALMVTAAS